MANEGSTKPTYEELAAQLEQIVEAAEKLRCEDPDRAAATLDMSSIGYAVYALGASGWWGRFAAKQQARAVKAEAELARVRGLLQRGRDLLALSAYIGIGGSWRDDRDKWLAESADIGKLDTADKSGVEMGKVNRVDEKCVAGCEFNGGHQAEHPCGKKLSDAAPLSTLLSLLKAENVQAAIDQLRRDGYRNVCNALADSVMELDDEQIIQETKDAGLDPVAEAERVRQIIQRAAGSAETGGEKDDDELKELRDLPDDKIDTSDIPEVTDWSKAERGKFYKPPGPESREPEKLNNAQKRAEFIRGAREGWMRACVFYLDIDAEYPDSKYSKDMNERWPLVESSLSSPPPAPERSKERK